MANSAKPGPQGTPQTHHHRHRRHTAAVPPKPLPPAKTPGTQGRNDQHDPTTTTLLGWTPNLTGFRDWADHTWQSAEKMWQDFTHTPGGVAVDPHTQAPVATGAKPPVAGDLDLSFLGDYVGGELSNADIEAAAKELNCDADLIYGISRQESGSSSFATVCGRLVPVILYERHIFRNLTAPHKGAASPYQLVDPEICGDAYHTTIVDPDDPKKKRRIDAVTKLAPNAKDLYASGARANYERLCRAYKLDKAAALKACSWGKYQIMGFNFDPKTQGDVFHFVKDMSSGEPAHIKAFLRYAKSRPKMMKALHDRDFEGIAEGHNGAQWRTKNPNYAKNVEAFAKQYKK